MGRDDEAVTKPGAHCPHCDSADTEIVSDWGGQLITSQARCHACHTYFEVVRDVFDAAADPGRLAAGH